MRTLPKPTDDAGEVYRLCISRIRRQPLKQRLQLIEPDIIDAASKYDIAASHSELYGFPRSGNFGDVENSELIAVYVDRMARRGQPGRSIYDKLMISVPLQRCPLCAFGRITTLDHYLPKSGYPVLAVTPTNLVPACDWCQRRKRQEYPRTAEEQTMHPYYDDFTDGIWLKAIVAENTPASFCFFADPPEWWHPIRRQRVTTHFETFKLASLYGSNAGNELLNIREELCVLFDAAGPASVQSHLAEAAASRENAFLNSWETAMYRAAATNDWFCNGGFARN